MNQARETIYAAVLAALQGKLSTNFPTISRRMQAWSELSPEQQPAIFQVQKGEDVQYSGRGIPPRYKLTVDLEVYAYYQASNEDPASALSSVINPLLDAIETAFAPDPVTGMQTLNIAGVSHCWIEGTIEIFEGDLNSQIMAVVPVSILTT